jgi:hypothetical protein
MTRKARPAPGAKSKTRFVVIANQLFGQVEAGYRLDLGGRAAAYLTPFARLQGSTARQNGFTESGADSLDLSVAAQTTDSLRSVIGAEFGGAMDMGWRDKLTAQLKLGWGHELASTDRPVTAAFAGAPAVPFTTFGATPNRDGVVLASTPPPPSPSAPRCSSATRARSPAPTTCTPAPSACASPGRGAAAGPVSRMQSCQFIATRSERTMGILIPRRTR